jgi:hypothetical protein
MSTKSSVKAPKSLYNKCKKLNKPSPNGHYHTGVHKSPKATNGPAYYRSGWEKIVLEYLDGSADVVSYEYESIAIPYISNNSSGKVRYYYPDFVVHYADGRNVIVEVKRLDKVNDLTVRKKTEAARKWAQERGMQYQIWTNSLIFQLKTVNEVRKVHQKAALKKK